MTKGDQAVQVFDQHFPGPAKGGQFGLFIHMWIPDRFDIMTHDVKIAEIVADVLQMKSFGKLSGIQFKNAVYLLMCIRITGIRYFNK